MNNSAPLSPRIWRYIGPIPACCIAQALFGLLYATGVFVALIDLPQFTISIGIAGFCTSLGVALGGVAMNKLVPPSHAQFAPIYVALAGSIGLSAQLLMPYALYIHSTPLLYTSAALYGIGCGCLYVASIDVVHTWVPDFPGLATGSTMLCGPLGSLFGIKAFRFLSVALNTPSRAILVVAAISSFISFLIFPLLRRPPYGWTPHQVNHAQAAPLLPSRPQHASYATTLTFHQILCDPAFYLLVVAYAATVGPGFGFVIAFHKMATHMFPITVDNANDLFFWITLTGAASRLIAGVAIDVLDDQQHPYHFGFQGAKRTNLILLIAQLFALLSIPFMIKMQYVNGFGAAVAIVYISFNGGSVVASCLVRGVFNPNNASLTFSLAAISIGAGDMFFSWCVARCIETSHLPSQYSGDVSSLQANDFNLFFAFGVIWSIAGLIATWVISKSSSVSHEPIRDAELDETQETSNSVGKSFSDEQPIFFKDVITSFEKGTECSSHDRYVRGENGLGDSRISIVQSRAALAALYI